MSLEQAVYKAVFDLFAADTGSGGLNETGGTAFVNAGMIRTSEPVRKRGMPRIEVEVRINEHLDAGEDGGGRVANGIVLMHLLVERELAFGSGATPESGGKLQTLEDRVRTKYDQWKPTLTGWTSGRWTMLPPRIGPETPEAVHRILPFAFGACE